MIYSFYSYKGGVGRTQLVANLASYLCYKQNKKILLFEWDLEAPGLDYYFSNSNTYPTIMENGGLIDIVTEVFSLEKERYEKIGKEELEQTIKSCIVQLVTSKEGKQGCIDLFPSGRYHEAYYMNQIDAFDWSRFYQGNGYDFFEKMKATLKNMAYDYILIDSRTGMADYPNICNIQLPDVNVLVIAPNQQNYEGAYKMAQIIKNSKYVKDRQENRPILPILSRLDIDSKSEGTKWLKEFSDKFVEIFYPKEVEEDEDFFFKEFVNKTYLRYDKGVANGENLLFNEHNIDDSEFVVGLAEQYKYIAENVLSPTPDADFILKLADYYYEKSLSNKDKSSIYKEYCKKKLSYLVNNKYPNYILSYVRLLEYKLVTDEEYSYIKKIIEDERDKEEIRLLEAAISFYEGGIIFALETMQEYLENYPNDIEAKKLAQKYETSLSSIRKISDSGEDFQIGDMVWADDPIDIKYYVGTIVSFKGEEYQVDLDNGKTISVPKNRLLLFDNVDVTNHEVFFIDNLHECKGVILRKQGVLFVIKMSNKEVKLKSKDIGVVIY